MSSLTENTARIVEALGDIKQAIIDKGVTPSGKCETYADAIDDIFQGVDVSGDTATEMDVFSGKTFHLADGTQTTGNAVINNEFTAPLRILPNRASYTVENQTVNEYMKKLNLNVSYELSASMITPSTEEQTIGLPPTSYMSKPIGWGSIHVDAVTCDLPESNEILQGKSVTISSGDSTLASVDGSMIDYRNQSTTCEGTISENGVFLKLKESDISLESVGSESNNIRACVDLNTEFNASLDDVTLNLGNATPDKVISGYTFSSSGGVKQTGTYVPTTFRTANGTEDNVTRTYREVTCGFKPKFLCISNIATAVTIVYDESLGEYQKTVNQSGQRVQAVCPNNTTTGCQITHLTDTGFTFRGYDTARSYNWFAIG